MLGHDDMRVARPRDVFGADHPMANAADPASRQKISAAPDDNELEAHDRRQPEHKQNQHRINRRKDELEQREQ